MSPDREDATPIDVPLSEAELRALEGTAPGGMVEIGARDLRRLLAQLRAAQAAERLALGEYLKQIREPDKDRGDGPDREEGAYDRGWNDCLDAIRQHLGMAPLSCACGNELTAPNDGRCQQCRNESESKGST